MPTSPPPSDTPPRPQTAFSVPVLAPLRPSDPVEGLVPRETRPHVLIIGGGFGGLEAAKALADAPVEVTLLDKRNHHLFQPLLYQVATAGLSGPDIAMPIRKILRHQKNTRVLLGEAVGIDTHKKRVKTAQGDIAYDFLVIATGVTNNYFGHDEWEPFAPGLKSLDDALEIRRRILLAFEAAELESDPRVLESLLTFVVVGGGPTGVELAGALAEIATHTLARNFRTFNPANARVILVEGSQRLLVGFDDRLAHHATAKLERLGVEIRLGKYVENIDAEGVVVGGERIRAHTVLWGAGVGGRRFEKLLTEAEIDRAGRITVDTELRVKGYDHIFAIGDIARFVVPETGATLPGVAQTALQQGKHVAENIVRIVRRLEPEPFHYRDLGSLATVGRSSAVAEIGNFKFAGFFAWLLWIFVHVMALVGFRNRVVVLFNWAMAYIFWARAARIVLERPGMLGSSPNDPQNALPSSTTPRSDSPQALPTPPASSDHDHHLDEPPATA